MGIQTHITYANPLGIANSNLRQNARKKLRRIQAVSPTRKATRRFW